jgi:hypothetical protein
MEQPSEDFLGILILFFIINKNEIFPLGAFRAVFS